MAKSKDDDVLFPLEKEEQVSKSLVPTKFTELGLTTQEIEDYELQMKQAEQEAMYGVNMRKMLPIIKLPMAGGTQFEISDMEHGVKSIDIVIPVVHKVKAYYHPKKHHEYNAEVKVPICASSDLITGTRSAESVMADTFYAGQKFVNGTDKLYGKCSQCVLNKFGTTVGDDGEVGGGKGCKDKVRLYAFSVKKFSEGNDIPYLLTLPVTSIGNWESYIGKLLNIKANPSQVVTNVTLTIIERGAQKYAVANFVIGSDLRVDNPALCVKFGAWRAKYANELRMIDAGVEEEGDDLSFDVESLTR